MVGKYLLAAKYAFIEWVNDEDEVHIPPAPNTAKFSIIAATIGVLMLSVAAIWHLMEVV